MRDGTVRLAAYMSGDEQRACSRWRKRKRKGKRGSNITFFVFFFGFAVVAVGRPLRLALVSYMYAHYNNSVAMVIV